MSRPTSFDIMKTRNEKEVLKIIKQNLQISRADIAEKTGLSPATVTNIVNDLIDNKLIIESDRGKSKGGRRPVFLKLNGKDIKVIGINWSINSIRYALVNLEGKIEFKGKKEIKNLTLGNFLKKTKEITTSIFNDGNKDRIKGIGIGIHGIVDPIKGVSKFAPHYKWKNKNILAKLDKIYELPIKVDNDVRMMARAERWKQKDNFIYINTGSGIGAAVVLNNRLIYGKDFLAGEIGHIIVKEDGPLCNCGNRGCLEAMVSKNNLIEYADNLMDIKISNWHKLCNIINSDGKNTKAILKYISRYFGLALVNIINLLNPNEIIIGGDFLDIKDRLEPYLNSFVIENSLNKDEDFSPIEFTDYNKIAGAVGAAFSILEKYFYSKEEI